MKNKLLLLGLSTGGPSHLKYIFSKMKQLRSTCIVAQHMKSEVMGFFIKDLDETYPFDFVTTPNEVEPHNHKVIVACEGAKIELQGDRVVIEHDQQSHSRFSPDINQLFGSAVAICDQFDICAVILTGIGDDGVAGVAKLKACGALTIAESKESATVYGMPRCAIENDAVEYVMKLDEIVAFLAQQGFIDV